MISDATVVVSANNICFCVTSTLPQEQASFRVEEEYAPSRMSVTAEISYRMPNRPRPLQSYFWQDYDLARSYPVLQKFLDSWRRDLDGPIHSARLAGRSLFAASDLRSMSAFGLNQQQAVEPVGAILFLGFSLTKL